MSNSLNVFLFENQIGEIVKNGINEIFNPTLEFENFIMQNPINIKLKEEIVQYDYTILPLYTVKDTVLPVPQIIDTTVSKIKTIKSDFLKSDSSQCLILNYTQDYNDSLFEEKIVENNLIKANVFNTLSC